MISALMQHWAMRWIVAPVAIIWALGYGWYQLNYPTCTFRYKITAEVQTPDGLKTGSSVVEVNYQRGGDWGGGPHGVPWARGEAVYIDLGAGKNLFVTLSRKMSGRDEASDIFSLPLKAWGLSWELGKERKLCADLETLASAGEKTIPFGHVPTLTTFANIDDSTSMQIVQPEKLAEAFGDGYAVSRISLKATNDPITDELDEILRWLPEHLKSGRANPFSVGLFWYDQFKQPGILTGESL